MKQKEKTGKRRRQNTPPEALVAVSNTNARGRPEIEE